MPDPGLTRPDLCSKRAAAGQAEPAGAAHGMISADSHPHRPTLAARGPQPRNR
jgi:hypothetical protein